MEWNWKSSWRDKHGDSDHTEWTASGRVRSRECGRTQHVRLGLTKSSIVRLLCGVTQGLVLGPILFVLYTADLVRLIEQHGLHGHLFADDTQVILSTT